MTDTITLTGIIATDPRALVTQSGLSISSFRLASSQRRYDRVKGEWVDGDTNWYTVTAFRQLADNVLASLRKGQRVVVTGRLRIRSWESGERSGVTVEVDADAIGHDLVWGTSTFRRRVVSTSAAGQGASADGGPATSTSADGPPTDTADDGPGPVDTSVGGAPTDDVAAGAARPQAPVDAPDDASDWGAPRGVGADEALAPF